MAVAMEALQFQARVEHGPLTGLQKAAEAQAVGLPVAGRHDGFRDQSADCLGFWPPEHNLSHRIPVGDQAVGVHRDEGVERGIEDAA